MVTDRGLKVIPRQAGTEDISGAEGQLGACFEYRQSRGTPVKNLLPTSRPIKDRDAFIPPRQ